MAQNVNPYMSEQTNHHTKQNGDPVPKSSDNHAVSKRLQKELMILMMSPDKSVSAFPEGDNLFRWIGTINGPKDSAYEGLSYKLHLEFPCSYPYTAPNVKFISPVFHPNVDTKGHICLDILKDNWSALYDVRSLLLSIQSLLAEPNIKSPLNTLAAEMWKNQQMFKTHVLDTFNDKSDNIE